MAISLLEKELIILSIWENMYILYTGEDINDIVHNKLTFIRGKNWKHLSDGI